MKLLFTFLSYFIILLIAIFIYQECINNDFTYDYKLFNNQKNNTLSIMTYNIRSANLDYGRHNWKNRLPLVINNINKYSPDIFGTQEGLETQLKQLEAHLDTYSTFGYLKKQPSDRIIENLVIFYKKDKFELISGDVLWLSDTSEIELSITWGNKYPRLVTYAFLKEKFNNKTILIINTHLDHINKVSRLKSSQYIVKLIKRINTDNVPSFILGDFNQHTYSEVYNTFIDMGYKDPLDSCINSNCVVGNNPKTTFHYYLGKLANYPIFNIATFLGFNYELGSVPYYNRFHIDWILYNNVKPILVTVCLDNENYFKIGYDLLFNITGDITFYERLKTHITFPSDHYPVFAIFNY
jgi:endonuclease/exonuclease/phosphatase family metal-dependent hydrolase